MMESRQGGYVKYVDGPAGPIPTVRHYDDLRYCNNHNRNKQSKPSLSGSLCALLLLAGIVWILSGMDWIRAKTPEEKQANWEAIGRSNKFVVTPQCPQFPSRAEAETFFVQTINPIWEKAAKRKNYYVEDYHADSDRIFKLCQKNLMPLFAGRRGFSFWPKARDRAKKNGWKKPVSRDQRDKISMLRIDREMNYTAWYNQASSDSPKIEWRACLNWLWISYWKGMLVCLLIFLIRIVSSSQAKLRDELTLAPLRFIKMLLVWPFSIFVYPHYTKTAIGLRAKRLEAEYLRSKSWNYQLSFSEKMELRELARQSRFSLKQLLTIIRSQQNVEQRKSLVLVFGIMMVWLIVSPLLRVGSAYGYEIQRSDITTICVCQARDGPATQTDDDHPDTNPLAIIIPDINEPVMVCLKLVMIIVRRFLPTIWWKIDYVPKLLS